MLGRNLVKSPRRNLVALQRRYFAREHILRKAEKLSRAPPSIRAIPAEADDQVGTAGAFIRPVGCSRRVFLINPYLTPEEIEGLAYRVRVLSSNEFLNSVLIATDEDDPGETGAMPSSLLEVDFLRGEDIDDAYLFDPKPGCTWHASGGYDPLEWYRSGKYKDAASVASLLDSVEELASATLGHPKRSRIPVISILNGMVNDSGSWALLSSYLIATEQTHFRILNPSRGLTFDPVGFSYMLPRLGQEFKQPSQRYKGCGLILALTGYSASASDMTETGLATHYMENPTAVMGTLERSLGMLPPWNQQKYTKNPIETEFDRQRFIYRPPEEAPDHNAQFRNVAVASTIHAFSDYHADGSSPYSDKTVDDDECLPAAFDFDPLPWEVERESDLVDYAATFDEIFQRPSVEGILDGFKEVAGKTTQDPDVQEGIDVAADFVKRLERQSPLALKVTYELMNFGEKKGEKIQDCMKREKTAQANMMTKPDFENWAKSQLSIAGSKSEPFSEWQHKTLGEVSKDEVLEVIGA